MANLIDFGLLFDPLSLFFIAVILFVCLPAAFYSVGYLGKSYSSFKIFLAWALLVLFIFSMVMVVTVNNAAVFLIAWEIMSLASYFLVIFEHKNEKATQAGTIYMIMTHIGTALITAGILIMFKFSGSFDFNTLKQTCSTLPAQVKNILFILFLIGFGTKAGIVPLHLWLPYAHPQAPSHISSIMSGVMIKTAVYGILRFIMIILGINSIWWGNLLLVLALLSCLVGITSALMETDLKKLLAYSSVENIGIIFLGIGASWVFIKMDLPVLAVFSLAAGLYHLLNHAVFKGLLFLCAGAVYKATGTKNIEKMGGLVKRMPQTAVFFLIGCMGISAIPPLSGFISEWLTLQAFFSGALNSPTGYRIFFSICACILALTGGLAAACFVKAFGISFLGLPRSEQAANSSEAGIGMRSSMAFLALSTVALGLACGFFLKLLTKVAGFVSGIDISNINFTPNIFTLAPLSTAGVYLSNGLIAVVLAVTVILSLAALYFILGRNRATKVKTWDCGYYKLEARNEYTATAFSKPFRIAFNFFLRPYTRTEKIRDSFYHVRSFKYELFTTPVFKRYIYDPVVKIIFSAARILRRLQPGSIHLYIAYIFITMIIFIVLLCLK